MCGHRVLVVDDEPDIRTILRRTLLNGGFCVCEAGDGIEALKAAQQCDISAILMDINMPRMSGTEAVRQLRLIPRFATTPIIIITANMNMVPDGRSGQVGDMLVFSKPLNLSQVLTAVQQAVLAA